MSLVRLFIIFLAAALGGAVNAVAGGGTLITFPAIVWLGVPPIVANATSTVALWPGALGGMWAYRGHLAGARDWVVRFTLPSLLGGGAGALLLLSTSARTFDRVVPFLVLGATLLFMVHGSVVRWVRSRMPQARPAVGPTHRPRWGFLLLQFGVAIYGGYFGAGIGILMLATLGLMGLTSIHQMNGLKNWGGLCINAVAAITFALSGIVDWPVALAMAAGGLAGGYAGAMLAQQVGETWVRRSVVVIGLVAFVSLLVRS